MSAKLTVGNLTVTGENHVELFENMASYQEVFDVNLCGKCKSENVRFVVREVDGNKFYELHCNNCRAKLSFGKHKTNDTLFPHRKYKKDHEKAGEYIPNNGWLKWNPETKQEE